MTKNEMDKELQDQFLNQFMQIATNIVKDENIPEYKILSTLLESMGNFIKDIYNVGVEVGELEGRLKGYDQALRDEKENREKELKRLIESN